MILNQHNEPLFIISAYNANRTPEENAERHIELRNMLINAGLFFSDCEGSYKGVKERSLIVSDAVKMQAHHYATIYRQESFIRLKPTRDNAYKASFIDTATGIEEEAGIFRSVTKDVIDQFGLDYTQDAGGNYFTIMPELTEPEAKLTNELVRTMEKHNRV